jgi:signal transduction histidine kinase
VKASTARRAAWSIGVVSIALLIAALVFMYLDRRAILPEVSDSWRVSNVFDVLVSTGPAILGIVIAARRRESPIGWLFLVAGFDLAIGRFTRAYALHALVADRGSLPLGRVFGWISNGLGPVAICMLPFLFLLFPTDHLPSRRWRPVAWLAGADLVVLTASALVYASSLWSRPFAELGTTGGSTFAKVALVTLLAGYLMLTVVMLLSFAAVAVRFSRSRGDERLQLKWFVTAGALVAVTFLVSLFTNSPHAGLLFDGALLLLYAAIGIAILKYRLYDIDVIISKAVVYGGLAAFITAVYVLLVAVIGAFIGATEGLALVATAIVAVAFQPVRGRVQAVANRLVYGERATPYEVLSKFSDRIAETYSTEDVLPQMAKILGEGTGASQTDVWLKVGPELRHVASWPDGDLGDGSLPVVGDRLPQIVPRSRVAAASRVAEVRHQGQLLGALAVIKSPNEPLTPAEDKLLTDLASQAGLVLRNAALVSELRASRQRLVSAQDEERRRLERNLHDGAQQQLIALSVKQRLAGDLVRRDPDRAISMLAELQEDTAEAVENLRQLARGIYPPLLADQGLVAALQAHARKTSIPVAFRTDSVDRYPQEVEAAVYFCCLEALQNVSKYAAASGVTIGLTREAPWLTFTVEDDGVGFDVATTPRGTGLQGMADRLAALGGTLDIASKPGGGTSIRGRIPAQPPVAGWLPGPPSAGEGPTAAG